MPLISAVSDNDSNLEIRILKLYLNFIHYYFNYLFAYYSFNFIDGDPSDYACTSPTIAKEKTQFQDTRMAAKYSDNK